jgi:hypothetical protein
MCDKLIAEHRSASPLSPFGGEGRRNAAIFGVLFAIVAASHVVAAGPRPEFRVRDTRPKHDDAKLEQLGIAKFESRRLRLYTDIDSKLAKPLPPVMDQLYDVWEAQLGKLPPAPDKADFQMTGYLMKDRELFRKAELLPETLPGFAHGCHRGAEFWMDDQPTDYYRRHLMLHEGTHCFMTAIPTDTRTTVWYFEGAAELFATHTLNAAGKATFGVMPHNREDFPGLGRIKLVMDDAAEGKDKDVASIWSLTPGDFQQNSMYAWSWALCKFLDAHPRYRERFQSLLPVVRQPDPKRQVADLFAEDWTQLQTEWMLFVTNLRHGYDIERAAIEFKPVKPLVSGSPPVKLTIAADRGWQSAGVTVREQQTIRITASGRFSLAKQPKPWLSEPQGVSIRYHRGEPVGKLVAIIVPDDLQLPGQTFGPSKTLPVGRATELTAPLAGTLFFRVNDHWNELSDNAGEVSVEMHP